MTQFSLRTLKRKIKKHLLFLPVTRYEVLQYAKELQTTRTYGGLCNLLDDALMYYNIYYPSPTEIHSSPAIVFSKFRLRYAKYFGTHYLLGYWWEKGQWDTGRLEFLDWLIDQYKNDKTNIRKL